MKKNMLSSIIGVGTELMMERRYREIIWLYDLLIQNNNNENIWTTPDTVNLAMCTITKVMYKK